MRGGAAVSEADLVWLADDTGDRATFAVGAGAAVSDGVGCGRAANLIGGDAGLGSWRIGAGSDAACEGGDALGTWDALIRLSVGLSVGRSVG